MTDSGVFSSGTDALVTIERLQAHHMATGFQSNFKHTVEVVPVVDDPDPSVIAVIRLHSSYPTGSDA